jgi:uncharacterized membrane protein
MDQAIDTGAALERNVRWRGRLTWRDLEGGVFVLEAENGRRYDLHGVEDLLPGDVDLESGVVVVVEGTIQEGLVDFHMVGTIVQVSLLELQE